MPKWTEEQMQAITKKGKNIIVSAGAGSGKTAVLSERVSVHLQNGIHIDEMLILTFTNAAAAEMKERIRTKISKNPKLKDELDKIDIAYITTFDAYALSLVKKYNYLLNISDIITITSSSIIGLKKQEILEKLFAEKYQNKDPKFLKLIDDFCIKDDKEVFNAVLKINNELDSKFNKIEYLDNYLNDFYSTPYINEKIKEYNELLNSKVKSIKSLIKNLSTYVDSNYIEKLKQPLLPLLSAKEYLDYKYNCNIKLPPAPKGSTEAVKTIKKQITVELNIISELTSYSTEEEIKESINLTKDYVSVIIDLIKSLDKEIKKYKKLNNAYEFIDISKMAIKILIDNEAVRNELKNKYKEILIDEYQDTNDLQDLFISQIENNNVYMVGDIKQSIYRFRNANPLLFKEKYDKYSNDIQGYKIDLNKNFRSRQNVTNNINLIFNQIMNNTVGGANYIESHQMIFGNTAYNEINNENYDMEILNYQKPKDKTFKETELEIFIIANDIKDKINSNYKIMDKETSKERNITYKDFVILIDRSTDFDLYKKIFEYMNIPLTIYRDTNVSDTIDIGIIKNLYNLIININTFDTNFKYSFMSIARSYLFAYTDNEILTIINTNSYKETEIYKKALSIAETLDTLNSTEIFDKIINTFGFYNKIINVGDVHNHLVTLESIGKIVKDAENFGYTPKEFYDYLCAVEEEGFSIKLSLNKDSGNSVKIMTIHASKGLEYHICYFSGLSKKFNISDLKGKFMYSNHYGIITPYIDNGIRTTIFKKLAKQKYIHEEISEKLRLFYVALTRAREKIILVTSLKENVLAYKENGIIDDETRLTYISFIDILNSVYPSLTKYIKEVNVENLKLTKDYNYKKNITLQKPSNNTEKLIIKEYQNTSAPIEKARFSKNEHTLYTKEDRKNIDLGLELHSLFENTNLLNPDYTNMSEFNKNIIQTFINTGILNNSLKLYKEYEFIYTYEEKEYHGFIDLLIEYKDYYAIIDYKLKNTIDEAYKKQLKGYQNYIESLTGKKAKTYLYSILEGTLISI